jgi:hypothetical protein
LALSFLFQSIFPIFLSNSLLKQSYSVKSFGFASM